MTERIKDLAKQAGFDSVSMIAFDIEQDMEKFAELIVRETMQVVANNLPSNTYLDVAHAVIEHFKE